MPGEVVSLVGDGDAERSGRRIVYRIKLEQIRACAKQPRQYKDLEDLRELASSIQDVGQLVPAIVRRLDEPQGSIKFELVAGERRYLASQLVGRKTLECLVYEKIGEREQYEIAMIENFHRKALSPLEEAAGLARMKENGQYSNKELAARVGMSEITVVHRLAILNLDKRVQRMLRHDLPEKDRLPVTAAQIVEPLPKKEQLAMARAILTGTVTLRGARNLVRKQTHQGVRRADARNRRYNDDYKWIHGWLERGERDAGLIAETATDVFRKAYASRERRDLLASLRLAANLTVQVGKIIKKLKQVSETE